MIDEINENKKNKSFN